MLERELEQTRPTADEMRSDRLRTEAELVRTALRPPTSRPSGTVVVPGVPAALALERRLRAAPGGQPGGPSKPRDDLAALLGELERRLAEQVAAESNRRATVAGLRAELQQLKDAVEQELGTREAVEQELGRLRRRGAEAYEAIVDLRLVLAALREAPDPPLAATRALLAGRSSSQPAEQPSGIAPGRLDAALLRLRQATPGKQVAAPAAPGRAAPAEPGAWLEPALRRLAARDAALAGRIVIELFGMPQPAIQPGRLARLLVGGPIHRRLATAGTRRGIAPLRARVQRPGLHVFELTLDPYPALVLISAMIEPTWTAGERFTIVHRAAGRETYLRIRDGRPPSVTEQPPLGPLATTIRCPPQELAPLLAGELEPGPRIRGSERPIALLVGWVSRAQKPPA
jgi:hypothetical protein